MAKRNRTKAKSVKRRIRKKKAQKSPFLLRAIFYLVGCALRAHRWLVVLLWRTSRKNPLLALGFFLFALTFAIIGYNAVFLQKGAQRSLLFQQDNSIDSRLRALIVNNGNIK